MTSSEQWSIDLEDETELVIGKKYDEAAVYIEQVKLTNDYALGSVIVPFTHIRRLARVLSEAADRVEGKS